MKHHNYGFPKYHMDFLFLSTVLIMVSNDAEGPSFIVLIKTSLKPTASKYSIITMINFRNNT